MLPPLLRLPVLLAAALLLATLPARASDDRVAPLRDPLTRTECGDCHMAFQPAFLPAAAWSRIMDGLGDHFGDDASLPADKREAIRRVLMDGASDRWTRRETAPPLRLTASRWFLREHRFPDSVWKRPQVVTRSNCPACHLGADQGIYEED